MKNISVPAIPPDDYQGSIADWMIALQTHGFWDGENPEFYGDVKIESEVWWMILEECENN